LSHPFAGRRTLVLSMDEVRRVLDVDSGIEVQRQVFLALAAGSTVTAPNSWLRLPGERRGWLKLLAGYDGTTGGLGVKVLARFPNNPPGANLGSLIFIFDENNGFPLAIMDGVYVTAVRTGASAALATEALAAPDARRMALIGTGVVAWYSVLAINRVRPNLNEILVFSRSEHRRGAFAERAERELDVHVVPVGTVQEAVAGSDVIVTATNSPNPVLLGEHVDVNQHVNAMGIRTEIAPDAVKKCFVIGDGMQETINDGKFSVALAEGAVTLDDLTCDLGQVLAGKVRPGEAGRPTLFDSSGVAIQDVACAQYVWGQATRLGLGTVVDLGLDRSP
jgi:ornithine cyclodeaminase/alanine dehydrogenase-like protein (mu-crystallin family)